jgi:hypothetical protein
MKFLLLSIGGGLGIALLGLVSVAAAGPLVCREPPPTSDTSAMCDWEVDGSPYYLKYYRNFGLRTRNRTITRAVIVVHGRSINPFDYYHQISNAAIDRGISNSTLIIAPCCDRRDNLLCGGSGDPSSDSRLCWGGGGNDDYTAGGNASNDLGNVNSSSYAIVNEMIDHLANRAYFPNLNTIIVTGQSAGGQFTQR